MGYGLLGLKPDELFSLTAVEFSDMLEARLLFKAVDYDRELDRTAWQTALLMSATGNYGKGGVDASKLYKRQYTDLGEVKSAKRGVNKIDAKEKERQLNELINKFNSLN